MDTGHFYFLKDEYFIDFPDPNLMQNKENVNGIIHERPCFYAFIDNRTNIYWMIPFSSRIIKYQDVHRNKVKKYGYCDTIVFGDVLGYKKAFLIQNMCPVIPRYIHNEYIDSKFNYSVRIDGTLEKELIKRARKVLSLVRKNINLIFPDVLSIEKALLKEIRGNLV